MQHENTVVIMCRMMLVLKNFSKEIPPMQSHEVSTECKTSGVFARLLSVDS
jgi:hypothetical protein